MLPDGFEGPSLSTLLASLHLLSLLDVLWQLPLDVLQHAFTAVAGGPQFVWNSLRGLRVSCKAGREFCNSIIQQAQARLPQYTEQSTHLAQLLCDFNQLQGLCLMGTLQHHQDKQVPQDGGALIALLEALQPSPLLKALQLRSTCVSNKTFSLLANKLFNLKKLDLASCRADDDELFNPLTACQHLASLTIQKQSEGKVEFQEALPSLVELTQLTHLQWHATTAEYDFVSDISHLTSLRVLDLCPASSRDAAIDCDIIKVLEALTQLEQLHVDILSAEGMVALNGRTSLTKLCMGQLDLFEDSDEQVMSVCIPNLCEVCVARENVEGICGLEELHMFLHATPALQTLHWPQLCKLEYWGFDYILKSENGFAQLLNMSRSGKLPIHMFEQIILHELANKTEEQLLAIPVVCECRLLQVDSFATIPESMVAILISRFPAVTELHVKYFAGDEVSQDVLLCIGEWSSLSRIVVDNSIDLAYVVKLQQMFMPKGINVVWAKQ